MPDSSNAPQLRGNVRRSLKHDSAYLHVSGEAVYIDDVKEPADCLHLYIAMSDKAHAKILAMDLDGVRSSAEVVDVVSAENIPGSNDIGAVIHDEPLFADGKVWYHGQPIFAVAASSIKAARLAAAKAKIDYEILDPLITIDDARQHKSRIEDPQIMESGDAESTLKSAPINITSELEMGGQDHFYLEGHIALATPGEDGDMHILSSTQNPTEAQHLVAHLLDLPSNRINVEVRRMGGGFGGKETQSAILAASAALVAQRTGRAVKCRLDRDDDMIMTGKRHDFQTRFEVGVDEKGVLQGAMVNLGSRCGYATDLSMAINDRAMFHSDNAYSLGPAKIVSERYRTNTVSNTAFRGFGGPQGMIAIERLMDKIAFEVKRDPLDVRIDNLYRKEEGRSQTPYGQTVEELNAKAIIEELVEKSNYRERRKEIEDFNNKSGVIKRGIALTPVKFGISFTTTHLNQAGALIHVYTDGSVQLNHGGTEMGQGLMTKVAQVVAHEFQIDIDHIRIKATSTEKVPNTSATAASSGTDLNGMAAKAAARTIKERLATFLAEKHDVPEDQVRFMNNEVQVGDKAVIAFKDVVQQAYLARISLSSTGYYRTPKIHYDRKTHTGRPFYYFAYGAAVSEVEIDTLTGENRVVRADILHDVGQSLNPSIDKGQIEGGFIQGMGWLTTEELVFDEAGRLRTHAPSTYKIPTSSDRPSVMNIELWENEGNSEKTIHRSKAVGEPPFMLANSVFSALTHAVSGAADHQVFPELDAPATPERILMAVEAVRAKKLDT